MNGGTFPRTLFTGPAATNGMAAAVRDALRIARIGRQEAAEAFPLAMLAYPVPGDRSAHRLARARPPATGS